MCQIILLVDVCKSHGCHDPKIFGEFPTGRCKQTFAIKNGQDQTQPLWTPWQIQAWEKQEPSVLRPLWPKCLTPWLCMSQTKFTRKQKFPPTSNMCAPRRNYNLSTRNMCRLSNVWDVVLSFFLSFFVLSLLQIVELPEFRTLRPTTKYIHTCTCNPTNTPMRRKWTSLPTGKNTNETTPPDGTCPWKSISEPSLNHPSNHGTRKIRFPTKFVNSKKISPEKRSRTRTCPTKKKPKETQSCCAEHQRKDHMKDNMNWTRPAWWPQTHANRRNNLHATEKIICVFPYYLYM